MGLPLEVKALAKQRVTVNENMTDRQTENYSCCALTSNSKLNDTDTRSRESPIEKKFKLLAAICVSEVNGLKRSLN